MLGATPGENEPNPGRNPPRASMDRPLAHPAPAAPRPALDPHNVPTAPHMGPSIVLLNVLCAALWGGLPVAIRYTTDRLPPVMVAGVRFGLATVFMLFWCLRERSGFAIRPGQWQPIWIMGGLLFLQIGTFNVGVAESNSSHGSLFINTFVFWVSAIEHFITRRERLSARQFCGLLLAGGSALTVLAFDAQPAALEPGTSPLTAPLGDVPTLYGDMILLISALILAIKTVYTKTAVQKVEPGKLIFWHNVIGTLLFFAYSFAMETTHWGDFTPSVLWWLAYQGVLVAGFCFAVQAVLLLRYSASQVSVFSALTPLFGILLGAQFRGDPLSPWLLVSGLFVAVGIWLVTQPARGAEPA